MYLKPIGYRQEVIEGQPVVVKIIRPDKPKKEYVPKWGERYRAPNCRRSK